MPQLTQFRHTLAQQLGQPAARALAKTGISPNALTILGFLLSLVVAWVLSQGHLLLGGFLVLVAGGFDLIDGALARVTGRATPFGAILDSTLDRFSEAALFIGVAVYFLGQHLTLEVVLAICALVGSLVTSYVRARAESLGFKAEVGSFTRSERVILLALGLIFTPISSLSLLIVLWILAVWTNLTAAQRLFYAWQQTKKPPR